MPLAVRVEGDYSLPAFEDSLKIKVKQPAPFPLFPACGVFTCSLLKLVHTMVY